jgi:putative Holliday junction resolvase
MSTAMSGPLGQSVVLGFDFGSRRIGVAIGNGITRVARPLVIIDAQAEARWPRVSAMIAEWQPARLVVGIPRHPDGTPHEMTARCEKFARQLHGRYALPVDRVDERYSSTVVEAGRDDEAAAVILQQWFNESHSAASLVSSPTTRTPAGAAGTCGTQPARRDCPPPASGLKEAVQQSSRDGTDGE